MLTKQGAELAKLKAQLRLNQGVPNQIQLVHCHKQVRALTGVQYHESALLARAHRAERATVGAPDGAAAAGDERVIDSLVGLGLFRGRNGEGVDLSGLHATTFLLRFADFSCSHFSFKFF